MIDFEFYARNCLFIRHKDDGQLVSLVLNKAQQYIHSKIEAQRKQKKRVRAIILKGRQQGCSTYTEARFYWRVTHRPGVRAFILTHEAESTSTLFDMAVRYHDNCPEFVRPSTEASNAKELVFGDLDSGYKVGTAGNKGVGRGNNLQYFHGSEVAFWPHAEEHAKGILQAVPRANETEIILESTANGLGNYFHQMWQSAESGDSDFLPIFVPWYWQEEYRADDVGSFEANDEEQSLMDQYGVDEGQLLWRREKVAELSVNGMDGYKAFKQEYPFTAAEAFQNTGEDGLIKPDDVMKARKTECIGIGPKVLGVDPARGGADRVGFAIRKGRRAWDVKGIATDDTMKIVGRIVQMDDEEDFERIFIDVGGIGAGVVDRLKEMGYNNIREVNFGSSATMDDKYVLMRDQMWGELNEWLKQDPVDIPDSDELHADLIAPGCDWHSRGRLTIESKRLMKKRGIRSPDLADALALTFAYPVREKTEGEMSRRSARMTSSSYEYDPYNY